jgi:hypothetical protein
LGLGQDGQLAHVTATTTTPARLFIFFLRRLDARHSQTPPHAARRSHQSLGGEEKGEEG